MKLVALVFPSRTFGSSNGLNSTLGSLKQAKPKTGITGTKSHRKGIW